MKKLIFITGILLIYGGSSPAQIGSRQTFFELQFGAGPSFMITDIGKVGYGGNVEVAGKYRLHPNLAIKAQVGAALGLGSDAGTENESRGLQYYTIVAEITGQLEYYILKEGRGYGKGGHVGYKPRVRPYLFAGGGPTLFYPTHTNDDAGEPDAFNNFTVILVGGAGFLYRVNANIFWGFQAGGRLTTTDLLEGLAPDDATGNDNYISAQVLLLYRF